MRVVFLSAGDSLTLEKDTEILINARYWENRHIFREVVGVDGAEMDSMSSSFKEVGGFKSSISLKAGTELTLEKIETRKAFKDRAKYLFSIEKSVFNGEKGRYLMALDPHCVSFLECSRIVQLDSYEIERKKLINLVKRTLKLNPKQESKDNLRLKIARKFSTNLISAEAHDELCKMIDEFSFEKLEKNKGRSRKAMQTHEIRITTSILKAHVASGSSMQAWHVTRLVRVLGECKASRSAEEYAELIRKFDIESVLPIPEELKP